MCDSLAGMGLTHEIRRRTRAAVAPFLLILMVVYFGLSFVHGDRGLIAWLRLNEETAIARAELAGLQEERARLEHRVRLLHPDSLDLDMLDERARALLGYVHRDDVILYR